MYSVSIMKELNLGLIGLGMQGRIHLRNCLRLEGVRVAGVSDISKKALLFARRKGIKNRYRDYNRLLNDGNVDAVIISLPNHLHLESTVRAAEAGKDVFLEKPLARDAREGEKVLSAVRRNGVRFMLGYPLRFHKLFNEIRDKILDGFFGEVQIADASNVCHGPFSSKSDSSGPSPVPSWWFRRELTGGGALLDLGSHLINLLTWYFGEVIDTKSYLGYRFNMDFEDLAVGVLRFDGGPIAIIKAGWFSKDFQLCLQVCGSAKSSVVQIAPTSLGSFFNAIRAKMGKFGHDPFYEELHYFVNCLRSDISPTPSGEEGLTDLRVISTMYENASALT